MQDLFDLEQRNNIFFAGRNDHIDQAIYESEKEMQDGGKSIDLDDAFAILNKKYYGEI